VVAQHRAGRPCGVPLRVVGDDLNVRRAVLVEFLWLQTLAFSVFVVLPPAAILFGVLAKIGIAHGPNCKRNREKIINARSCDVNTHLHNGWRCEVCLLSGKLPPQSIRRCRPECSFPADYTAYMRCNTVRMVSSVHDDESILQKTTRDENGSLVGCMIAWSRVAACGVT
jgi:hypothetical protein